MKELLMLYGAVTIPLGLVGLGWLIRDGLLVLAQALREDGDGG